MYGYIFSDKNQVQDVKGLHRDKIESRLYVGNLDFRISEWVLYCVF
jgi:hypothetical protein